MVLLPGGTGTLFGFVGVGECDPWCDLHASNKVLQVSCGLRHAARYGKLDGFLVAVIYTRR